MHVNIHHIQEDSLVELVARARKGEDIIFQSHGTPVAKLIPFKQASSRKKRQGGQWKGQVRIAPDFDELPDSFLAAFRTEKLL